MTKIKKNLFLAILFVGAFFVGVAYFIFYPAFTLKKRTETGVLFLKQNIFVGVELAASPYAQAKGLMYRENLDESKGMLFIFPDEQIRSFWMKNTLISLDMIFISADKRIVDIKENALPCKTISCPSYSSKEKAMYVLEVNGGFVKKNNIKIGEQVQL